MDTTDTTTQADQVTAIAGNLESTPEKVTALLTAVAAHSVYPLDYLTEMVFEALPSV